MARIPQNLNIEAARKYWDIHTVDEVAGERVEVEVRKPLSHVLSVRLDNDDFHTLIAMAKNKKIGVTTLARQLLHETLARNERPSHEGSEWVVKLDLSKRQLSHIAERISVMQKPQKRRKVPA